MSVQRVETDGPGFTRKGRGKGFEYFDASTAEKITDAEQVQRLKDLVIPPAWQDVWICPDPNGHIQAVGYDEAGRRQYIYHEQWRAQRDAEKFDRMLDFARWLPALRSSCSSMLEATDKLTRERVLACAVRLLDLGFFRIGGESYAAENETYGLATMRKEHVSIREGGIIEFDYTGKHGKRRLQNVVDEAILVVVKTLRLRRTGGDELLAYRTSKGWRDVTSADINEFVKSELGEEHTAKDFRTWNATVLAAVAVAVSGPATRSAHARKRAVSRACQEVAHYLGNTPAVARGSYIDPRVFERYEEGWTVLPALERLGDEAVFGVPAYQGAIETAVIALLEDRRDADGVAAVEDV